VPTWYPKSLREALVYLRGNPHITKNMEIDELIALFSPAFEDHQAGWIDFVKYINDFIDNYTFKINELRLIRSDFEYHAIEAVIFLCSELNCSDAIWKYAKHIPTLFGTNIPDLDLDILFYNIPFEHSIILATSSFVYAINGIHPLLDRLVFHLRKGHWSKYLTGVGFIYKRAREEGALLRKDPEEGLRQYFSRFERALRPRTDNLHDVGNLGAAGIMHLMASAIIGRGGFYLHHPVYADYILMAFNWMREHQEALKRAYPYVEQAEKFGRRLWATHGSTSIIV